MAKSINNRLEVNDDVQFWVDMMPETVKNSGKTKGKAEKTNSKKEVRAVIDSGEGVAAVKERKQNSWQMVVPFRGTTIRGFNERLFSKKDEERIKSEIFDKYVGNNKYMSAEQQAKILERINKNVDIKMFKILRDYDISNYWETNKSQEYVNAMVKNVKFKRKKTDSARQLAKKEDAARRKELRNAGIVLTYDLRKLVFNKNNPIDNIKVLANALKHRRFAEVKFFAFTLDPENRRITRPQKMASNKVITFKKKERQLVPLKLKKTEKAKKYTSKESLIEKFKNKVNEIDWNKAVRRGLVTAGLIGLIGLSGHAMLKDNNTQASSGKEVVTVMAMDEASNIKHNNVNKGDRETIADIVDKAETTKDDITIIVDSNQNDVTIEDMTSSTINVGSGSEAIVEVKEEESITDSNVVTDSEIQEDVAVEEKVILQDALMKTLDLGFDTEFSMGSGRYYEASGKTGRSGGYSNISNKVHINYVVAVKDGEYYKYNVNDGMSISDIKEAHSDADFFSYHVATDNMTLGWNDSTENDIETNLVKGALMDLKSYLSPEAMEFLCNNDLKGEVSSTEFAKYASELEAAQAKMQENNNLELSIEER